MKKTILSLTILAIAGFGILVGCKKKADAPDCTAMVNSVQTAITAYGSDPSSENCVKLQDAYRNYLSSSCIPEAEKAQTQQALDALALICQ